MLTIKGSAGVAQLVRACGSYPQGPGFKSLHRHHFLLRPEASARARRSRSVATVRDSIGIAWPDRSGGPCARSARYGCGAGGRVLVALSGGPTRSRCCTCCASCRTRRADGRRASRTSTTAARRRRDEDEAFCREHRGGRSDCRSCVGARRRARARASSWRTSTRGRRTRELRYAFLERAADRARRRRDRDRPHPRRPGGDLSAAAAPRRRPARAGRDSARAPVASSGRCSTFVARRAAGVARRERDCRSVRTSPTRSSRFTRNRVRHELLPLLEREFSPGIVEVLAARRRSRARTRTDLQAEAIELARSVVLRK